jgi:hypothetical protein
MKNIQLTEAELAAIIAAYSPYPSRVDYVSFVNAIYAGMSPVLPISYCHGVSCPYHLLYIVPNRRFGHTSPPLQLEPQKTAVPRPDVYAQPGPAETATSSYGDYAPNGAGGALSPGAAAVQAEQQFGGYQPVQFQ